MPSKGDDCPFSELIQFTSKYKCMFQIGQFSRCNLDCGMNCPYLVEHSGVGNDKRK